MKLKYIIVLPIVACLLSFACEHTDDSTNSRITIEIAGEYPDVDGLYSSGRYNLFADSGSFRELLIENNGQVVSDSAITPIDLIIAIYLPGELAQSLLSPNGCRVETRFGLESGDIIANHTNQADSVFTPDNDTLFAVYGEGIVSSGTGRFENISGLFFEESTYRIENIDGLDQITKISCKYELQVDF